MPPALRRALPYCARLDIREIVIAPVGSGTQLNEAIVGESVVVGSNSNLKTGVVVGDRCFIGENATIGLNVHLWCGSRLGQGTIIVD